MYKYEIIYQEIEKNLEYEDIVKKVFEECFKEEKMEESKLYITVTFTNPENIRKINIMQQMYFHFQCLRKKN